jgi:hypothetical protein
MPTIDPATSNTVSQNIVLISFTWLLACAGEISDIIKNEAPIQQAEIHSKDN